MVVTLNPALSNATSFTSNQKMRKVNAPIVSHSSGGAKTVSRFARWTVGALLAVGTVFGGCHKDDKDVVVIKPPVVVDPPKSKLNKLQQRFMCAFDAIGATKSEGKMLDEMVYLTGDVAPNSTTLKFQTDVSTKDTLFFDHVYPQGDVTTMKVYENGKTGGLSASEFWKGRTGTVYTSPQLDYSLADNKTAIVETLHGTNPTKYSNSGTIGTVNVESVDLDKKVIKQIIKVVKATFKAAK